MKMAIVVSIAFFGLLWASPAAAQGDLTAPVLVDLVIEPQVVDTAESAQVITFTARITDDLSGVVYASLMYHPTVGGTQWLSVGFGENDRIAGDELDGTYRSAATLPRYAAEGRWTLRYINAEDNVGNRIDLWSGFQAWEPRFDAYYFVNGEDNMNWLFVPTVLR